ncbi:MAG: Ku protein [Longimicrobiales bacterium]
MSARPIATSTISFGLVSLPVKLYATGESKSRVSFNMVHEKCGTRVKQQYICPKDDEIVPREDIVKGYEFAKGQYVLFTPEEIKAVEQPKTDSIEITEFVPADQVDRLFFDRAYYLGPDKGGARAYRLLSAALTETGRVAIAKYATRGKQYLVMVRPHDEGLIMEQLRYHNELRAFEDVPVEEGEVAEAELKLALQVVDQGASDTFDPTVYRDEVRERTMDLIQQKIDGEEITVAHTEEPQTQIIDLMAALKASLADGDEEGGRKPAKAAKSKKKASTRKKASSG